MIRALIRTIVMMLCMLLPVAASAGVTDFFNTLVGNDTSDQKQAPPAPKLPDLAITLGETLDAQLVERLGLLEGPAKGYSLIITTPVDLNNLERTSPLARQMGEELSLWFVSSGYRLQEIRKGRTVLFEPGAGEMLLTRRTKLLGNENIRSSLIMATTYSQTLNNVRFNVRLIHAATNEVLAMASQTLRLNTESRMLAQADTPPSRGYEAMQQPMRSTLRRQTYSPMNQGQYPMPSTSSSMRGGTGIMPSVGTRLP